MYLKGGWFASSYIDAKHYADQIDGVVTAAFINIKKPLVAGMGADGKFLEPNQAFIIPMNLFLLCALLRHVVP